MIQAKPPKKLYQVYLLNGIWLTPATNGAMVLNMGKKRLKTTGQQPVSADTHHPPHHGPPLSTPKRQ